MARDSQRQRVYDAENVLRRMFDRAEESGNRLIEVGGVNLTLPFEAKFASIESIQRYVDAVLALPAVRYQWPRLRPVTVRVRKGNAKAHMEAGGVMAIPDRRLGWAMREIVVLHELAHHLTWGHAEGHGPKFVAAFVELLCVAMAPEVGLALRLICADGNVKEGV